MLRTYHINNPTQQGTEANQLNVSECVNGKKVIIGIADGERYAEMVLNYQQFEDLCSLRYTLELSEDEPEQQLIETDQHTLKVA